MKKSIILLLSCLLLLVACGKKEEKKVQTNPYNGEYHFYNPLAGENSFEEILTIKGKKVSIFHTEYDDSGQWQDDGEIKGKVIHFKSGSIAEINLIDDRMTLNYEKNVYNSSDKFDKAGSKVQEENKQNYIDLTNQIEE
ncbi:hypothetical protein BFS35_009425 [Macrococcoides goetzii]|uniref:Lipoprotein n=1 Tax=Macrococcoides goetzii TaxID=1891097 RepID=A0A395G9H5_9STAP|nr:hypothetical protein [Macrococcus goetzii]RAI80650.1 hypothetical protein BFS35_009425 [Macrococcus goetzii]